MIFNYSLWFYLFSLEIPIVLGIIGLLLAFYKKLSWPIPWHAVALILTLATSLLVLNAWVLSGRHVSAARIRLYQSPVSTIRSIRIIPGVLRPLNQHELVVTNAATIEEIMATIRSAKVWAPNHPQTSWQCFLIISNSSGNSYIDATDTTGQGTILYCETSLNAGLIYDTLQSYKLGNILEKITRQHE